MFGTTWWAQNTPNFRGVLRSFSCCGFFSESVFLQKTWMIHMAWIVYAFPVASSYSYMSWTQKFCFWSPTSQFKQCWNFLLVPFTRWQFCVILLTFPVQRQQCPSFSSSEFFIYPTETVLKSSKQIYNEICRSKWWLVLALQLIRLHVKINILYS